MLKTRLAMLSTTTMSPATTPPKLASVLTVLPSDSAVPVIVTPCGADAPVGHLFVNFGPPLTVCSQYSSSTVAASAREEAKHAWRAKLAASAAEDAANRAWLARLDSRTWTEVVATVSAQVMSNGEESAAAKQSGLARLIDEAIGALLDLLHVQPRVVRPAVEQVEARKPHDRPAGGEDPALGLEQAGRARRVGRGLR